MASDERDDLARVFHEAYERLAPQFGYETRKASAVAWEEVPENNRALMLSTMDAVLAAGWRRDTGHILTDQEAAQLADRWWGDAPETERFVRWLRVVQKVRLVRTETGDAR